MSFCQFCSLSTAMVLLLASAPAVSSDSGRADFAFEAPNGVTASDVFALAWSRSGRGCATGLVVAPPLVRW